MSKFREYVRSSAFRIDLSHKQIQIMLALDVSVLAVLPIMHMGSFDALRKKGIVYHEMDKGFFFTEEGKHLVELLKICGFELEKEQ